MLDDDRKEVIKRLADTLEGEIISCCGFQGTHCGSSFFFSKEKRDVFHQKSFAKPKRCYDCREKKRIRFEETSEVFDLDDSCDSYDLENWLNSDYFESHENDDYQKKIPKKKIWWE